MHSSEMNVTDEWLGRYQNSLEKLVQQFNDKPQAATLKQEIDNVSVCVLAVWYLSSSTVFSEILSYISVALLHSLCPCAFFCPDAVC